MDKLVITIFQLMNLKVSINKKIFKIKPDSQKYGYKNIINIIPSQLSGNDDFAVLFKVRLTVYTW